MRKVLLEGRCEGGLYTLPRIGSASPLSKPSPVIWHDRLGHPSSAIVHRVVNEFSLPCQDNKDTFVCDACQQAKSHQLPYPKSVSESKSPLDLIFSDVWGPGPQSIGQSKFYVSFIDDYSKFAWVYPLKTKAKVFQRFHEFQ